MLSKIMVFILRPFIKPIRYGALKIMKRLRPPDDKRPAIATADHILDEIILPSVFYTFQESKFRELARFNKLPTSEHDRIFNELEVAGVSLAIFYLGTIKPFTKPGDFHFWRDVEEFLPKQLQRKLISYGVDSSNAKLLRKLIEMRSKEYDLLAEQVWNASEDKEPEFKNLLPEMKRIASLLQGIAIGTTDHIRRGEIKEKDPLIQYLIKWLLSLQREISKFVKKL
jgi:hypothetical protein